MNAGRTLLLAMILFSSIPALSAPHDSAMLGHVGKSSFWLNVPSGWVADQQAAMKFGAVFVLLPPGTTFNNAGAIIVGSSYQDKTVATAVSQTRAETLSRDAAAEIADLPSIDAGQVKISLLEIRSKTNRSQPFETIAFVALDQGVLLVTLSGLAEAPYKLAKGVFTEMLNSYEDAGMEIQQQP